MARLVLYPRDPSFAPARAGALEAFLRSVELIGGKLTPGRYLAGDGFLDAILFLGCAPSIELAPPPDAPAGFVDFCHVEIPPTADRPQLHRGRNLKVPRCPRCRGPFTTREAASTTEFDPMLAQPCETCGAHSLPAALNWRKSACICRTVINIRDVHESEAVPTPGLLDGLKNATGTAWAHCYITD